ncbi:MAG: hypothetical protein HC793_02415, partial [Aquincola sp.]|nr:hypothetical protein [Aquincola sp.]
MERAVRETAPDSKAGGAGASPFDSWLVLRGVRSLVCRMRTHAENGLRLAEFLAADPRVQRTFHPGLPEHPGHSIAARVIRRKTGFIRVEVRLIDLFADGNHALPGTERDRP